MITKANIGEFDSLEIFSEDYLKVKRNGLYALIDKNGAYVSNEWFISITKNVGGGFDVVKENKETREYKSVDTIRKAEVIERAVRSTALLSFIDFDNIIMLETTYTIRPTGQKASVTIIAKVNHMGMSLLLDSDGNLYYESGEPYIPTQFAISMANMNRIVKVVDEKCRLLNSRFDGVKSGKSHNTNDLFQHNIPFFVFAFNTNPKEGNKAFNTSITDTIADTTTTPWGKAIKLRILDKLVNTISHETMATKFESFQGTRCAKVLQWHDSEVYTFEYNADELDKLFHDLDILTSL